MAMNHRLGSGCLGLLQVNISNLCNKIRSNRILTVPGVGYRLRVEV